jgi:lambda family phage portal protein
VNWVDKAVGYVSPVRGLARQQARRALARSASTGHETMARGRRFGGGSRFADRDFGINTGNPNDARPKRYVSRQAILKLVAENPFARKAMASLLNSFIGWGIKGVPKGSRALKTAWADWIKVCDWRGRLDLYGLQELWARLMFRDGRVFVVKRFRKGGGLNGLRLQTFDRGMLAISKVGDRIEGGIEYDEDWMPLRYHFYRTRPGGRWWTGETVAFDAADVVDLFHAEDAAQTDGVSIYESVIKRLGDVEEGIEAEVVKANISACMVGFRYRPPLKDGDDDETIGLPVEGRAGDRAPVEEFVPGMIEQLEDGEQITFSNPPRSGGITDLARIALLASAAGVGTTYEQMTGDLSNVNFSSYKAGRLEFNRTIGRVQFLTFIPVCLDPVWSWFHAWGVEIGRWPDRSAPVIWTPPPIESIDRLGDVEADILEMEAGLEARENLLSGRGYDQDELIGQIKAGREKADGMIFKGDMVAQPEGEGLPATDDNRAMNALVRMLVRTMERSRTRAA